MLPIHVLYMVYNGLINVDDGNVIKGSSKSQVGQSSLCFKM